MTRFTIYTYLFKPINEPQEPDMFSPEVKVEESLAMKQELLGELFLKESKLRFTKSRNNSDSEYKQFEHLIVAQRDGIIVMRLANTTTQVHEKDFNRWTEEDNPSLIVIIDNRKDKQIIAIENRAQAFSDTQTDADTDDMQLQREVTELFSERYPDMTLNDWRHIIEAYTPMVRNASKSYAKEISIRQYDMAAESDNDEE